MGFEILPGTKSSLPAVSEGKPFEQVPQAIQTITD
jgi:hypothetical protein